MLKEIVPTKNRLKTIFKMFGIVIVFIFKIFFMKKIILYIFNDFNLLILKITKIIIIYF